MAKKKRSFPKKSIEVTEIYASSSVTVNLGNYNSAKLEMGITKSITRPDLVNIEEEKAKLWDEVNAEVDRQAEEIKAAFKK